MRGWEWICVALAGFLAGCKGSTPLPACGSLTPDASSGQVILLVNDENHPSWIAVDSSSVYWSNAGDVNGFNGTLSKVGVNGNGGQQTDLATGLAQPGPIALDATSVYFTTSGGDAGAGAVMKEAIGGGAPSTLASGQADPWGIAVDADSVYWANTGTAAASFTDGSIMKVPLAGGTPTPLATQQNAPFNLAIDAANVYWINTASGSPGIPGAVMFAPKSGGAPAAQVAGNVFNAGPIAVSSTTLYWVAGSGASTSTLMQLTLNGGTDAGAFVQNLKSPGALLLDATDMYFTDDGAILKVPLTGGTPITLANNRLNPLGVAVDCGSVYWADEVGGTVNKVSPK